MKEMRLSGLVWMVSATNLTSIALLMMWFASVGVVILIEEKFVPS